MNKKEERQFLYNKTDGRCGYCGCELPEKWHIDHIEPVQRNSANKNKMYRPERDVIENKIASCPTCNLYKTTFDVEQFRRELGMQISRLENHSINYRLAIKYKQLKPTNEPVVFYYEKNAP